MSPATKKEVKRKTRKEEQPSSPDKGRRRVAGRSDSTRSKGRKKSRGKSRSRASGPLIPPDDRRLTAEETKALWTLFKKTGDRIARNRLILHYKPLIRYAAERVKARLPREIDVADLESAGFFGLLDAVNGFDLSRGVKFETYCGPRIRGAILDELRSLDWVPRLVRARASRIDAASGALDVKLGRPATPQEMAKTLRCSVAEYVKLANEANTVGIFHVTQNAQDEENGRGVREIDGLQDLRSQDPSNRIQCGDLKQLVTRGLSRKERLIILLYYYEGLTMREIGDSLRLSESRVSQMHAAILLRLKKQLTERRLEFDIQPLPNALR